MENNELNGAPLLTSFKSWYCLSPRIKTHLAPLQSPQNSVVYISADSPWTFVYTWATPSTTIRNPKDSSKHNISSCDNFCVVILFVNSWNTALSKYPKTLIASKTHLSNCLVLSCFDFPTNTFEEAG